MRVSIVPCLSDNYAYLVECPRTGALAVVDPSEAAPVLAALAGRAPSAIWCTHHHPDHVGGVEELARAFPGIDVFAHASDRARIAGQTRDLEDGGEVTLGALAARVIHVPGHTLGALAWVVRGPDGAQAVFTGDTLFVAGCGRLFEGTAEQMFASLSKIAALAPETLVYCGHEYTASNVRFAQSVEDTDALRALAERTTTARAAGTATVPSTIAGERATNPFVRAKDAAELAARRAAKDVFR